MQAQEYITMRQVEDEHWWYAVLHGLVLEALTAGLKPGSRILDAGCGTGGMMAKLSRHPWRLDGVDLSPSAVTACRMRGLQQVQQADISSLPFPADSFDAVISLDVLYHESVDEENALMEMRRVLKPNGLLILNLPAFNCLRGSHDEAVCGARRYSACYVHDLLTINNMQPKTLHPWNATLFLPILLHRLWSRRQADPMPSDLRLPGPWLNTALTHLGHADARVCRKWHLRFGTSWFVEATKAPWRKISPETARPRRW